MQTKTEIDRAALVASIEKWERNAAVEYYGDITLRPEDCALCVIYFFKTQECKGCPVFNKTGASGCMDTPYDDAYEWRERWKFATRSIADESPFREGFQAAARAEVDFLRGLLAELPE